jgi:membrane protease YdiL (CAAX protease family)
VGQPAGQPMPQYGQPMGQPMPQYGQPMAPRGYERTLASVSAVTSLPLEDRWYHGFFNTPKFRWWRPVLAVLLAGVVWFIVNSVFVLIGFAMDGTLSKMIETGATTLTMGPWAFLGNNVGVATALPISMLTQWLLFGQRPKWMSSVQGGFRWGWFARCLAVVVPLWLVLTGVEYGLGGLPADARIRPYTTLMIVGILLTTPFQAAAEEYLVRGLLTRCVGGFFRSELFGWIAATVVSTAAFTALHVAEDPWLNLFYASFAIAASWIGWRTGGLEASVAIHIVNNLMSEVTLPFTDFSGMFDRSAGAGDPTVLFPLGTMVLAVGAIAWLAKRQGIVTRTAAGRDEIDRANAALQAAQPGYGWGQR